MTRSIARRPWPLDRYGDAGNRRSWIDRAEIDALFAIRHGQASRQQAPIVERHILRVDPPVMLLVADAGRPPPPQTDASRFCGQTVLGRSLAHHLLAGIQRSINLARLRGIGSSDSFQCVRSARFTSRGLRAARCATSRTCGYCRRSAAYPSRSARCQPSRRAGAVGL